MNFLEDIKPYENAVLPGVRLPQIKIQSKYYKELNIAQDCDNFTFLKALCSSKLTTFQSESKEYQDRMKWNLIYLES